MRDVICAFTPSQIIWGTDNEKLMERLKQSESGLANETGRFITFSDINYTKALSYVEFKIVLKNEDTTTFTFNDKQNNETFQVKLRHNLGLVQNSQKSIAQKTASEEVKSGLKSFKHVEKPTSMFGNLAATTRSIFTGGSTSNKNRTKHKSNHKSKAKTQSKPKHKNKSKPKPKPKHWTKAKTIKKNKRAHHKFDKKYTRKH